MTAREVECSKANFFFSNCKPWQLCSSQYRGGQRWDIAYAVYKWIAFSYFCITLWSSLFFRRVVWLSDGQPRVKWLIYLTNWTFLTFTTSCLVNAICATLNVVWGPAEDWKEMLENGPIPWYFKVNWILYEITNGLNLLVTILYWGILYTPGNLFDHVTLATHGLGALYSVVIDMCITAMPTRALHFWLPVLDGFTFVIFSVIYDVSGGRSAENEPYIYSVIDWNEAPGKGAVYAVGSLAGCVVCFYIIFGLYKLRVFIYNKFSNEHNTKVASEQRLHAMIENS